MLSLTKQQFNAFFTETILYINAYYLICKITSTQWIQIDWFVFYHLMKKVISNKATALHWELNYNIRQVIEVILFRRCKPLNSLRTLCQRWEIDLIWKQTFILFCLHKLSYVPDLVNWLGSATGAQIQLQWQVIEQLLQQITCCVTSSSALAAYLIFKRRGLFFIINLPKTNCLNPKSIPFKWIRIDECPYFDAYGYAFWHKWVQIINVYNKIR